MGRPKGMPNKKQHSRTTWDHVCQKCRVLKRMPINHFRCVACHAVEEKIYQKPVHPVMHDQYRGDFE